MLLLQLELKHKNPWAEVVAPISKELSNASTLNHKQDATRKETALMQTSVPLVGGSSGQDPDRAIGYLDLP